jgi:hypothetical protein
MTWGETDRFFHTMKSGHYDSATTNDSATLGKVEEDKRWVERVKSPL